jgi:hypothetical protein
MSKIHTLDVRFYKITLGDDARKFPGIIEIHNPF